MAKIILDAVNIEFPIYNVNARSFKKQFLRLATGGNVLKDSNQHIVVKSLDNLNLVIDHGDLVGLIGHNGSGKSTLLRLLAGIYEPTEGKVDISGHISTMLDITSGIEAEFTGYENIAIRGTLLGLSKKQIADKMQEIAAFTELGDYLKMPIRTYSSGMQVRLAFAISASIQPDILLIDEIFAAGDSSFMEKARQRMIALLQQSSIVVMATHSEELIKEFCNKLLLLESGRVKYYGPVAEGLDFYHRHRESVNTADSCQYA